MPMGNEANCDSGAILNFKWKSFLNNVSSTFPVETLSYLNSAVKWAFV